MEVSGERYRVLPPDIKRGCSAQDILYEVPTTKYDAIVQQCATSLFLTAVLLKLPISPPKIFSSFLCFFVYVLSKMSIIFSAT